MFEQIQIIINKALSLDPCAYNSLKKLQGKILKLEIQNTSMTFFIQFTDSGIQFIDTQIEPSITVQGPLTAFLNLAITRNSHQAAQKGLFISGDLQAGELIQTLFLSLNIDWEEWLSEKVGDVLAHQIGQFVHHSKKRHVQRFQNLSYSLSEYLKEEIHLLPTVDEVSDFLNQVDILRAEGDRLEAKFFHYTEQFQTEASS